MKPTSPHFKPSEFACECGCGKGYQDMDTLFLEQLFELREEYGKPMTITSAFRCQKRNEEVGGAKQSMHLLGRAVDIHVPPQYRHEFLQLALKYFNGVGLHKSFTHLDNRTVVTVFFY